MAFRTYLDNSESLNSSGLSSKDRRFAVLAQLNGSSKVYFRSLCSESSSMTFRTQLTKFSIAEDRLGSSLLLHST